ncbi:MAG: M14 family metallopeptidase [Acidobacteriota bacterium]
MSAFPGLRSLLVGLAVLTLVAPLLAQAPSSADASDAAVTALLPPALPWDGASRALALPPDSDDPWLTPSEASGLVDSPSYDETMDYLQRLVSAAPELHLLSIGRSGEGRDIPMVVASADGDFTPAKMLSRGKPIVLAQAGIHAGEIDAKDAGLMLLRDLTVRGELTGLLENVQLLFVPILNVDGHEHASRFGRPNQRGPRVMGWRTNGRNLNLNRDYAKADSREVQAILQVIERWRPELYLDLHVTDGIDYQYDITWGGGGERSPSPAIAGWLEGTLRPRVSDRLRAQGHVPGDLVFAIDGRQPDAGLFHWTTSTPRYSDGYGAARHLPTVLVENHSLKPYDQRVLGTYVFLVGVLETVAADQVALRRAIAADRARRPERLVARWEVDRQAPPEQVDFLGVRWRRSMSEISNREEVEWLGEPESVTLPRFEPTLEAVGFDLPSAYWVPAPWTEVIERLALHGIEFERLETARDVELDFYRLRGARLAEAPFEGRARVELPDPPAVERQRMTMPPGSVRVPVDQPLGKLAALLLEPTAPDSLFQWGFFLGILQRTEYIEGYVMAPTAERMLRDDPALRAEWDAALRADGELASNAERRLRWFYERTPYADERFELYPVGREPR